MCNPASLLSGGASILSGLLGRSASRRQARAITNATNQNHAATLAAIQQFAATDPFSAQGGLVTGASGQLQSLLGLNGADPTEMLRSVPGYEFRRGEGMRAVEGSLGAKHSLYSSKAMRDITRYGQDYADNHFQTAFNQRFNIAQQGSQSASAILNAISGNNNNRASGQIAAAGATADGTQSLIDGIAGLGTAIGNGLGRRTSDTNNPAPGG